MASFFLFSVSVSAQCLLSVSLSMPYAETKFQLSMLRCTLRARFATLEFGIVKCCAQLSQQVFHLLIDVLQVRCCVVRCFILIFSSTNRYRVFVDKSIDSFVQTILTFIFPLLFTGNINNRSFTVPSIDLLCPEFVTSTSGPSIFHIILVNYSFYCYSSRLQCLQFSELV
jgi:hypothetical protein